MWCDSVLLTHGKQNSDFAVSILLTANCWLLSIQEEQQSTATWRLTLRQYQQYVRERWCDSCKHTQPHRWSKDAWNNNQHARKRKAEFARNERREDRWKQETSCTCKRQTRQQQMAQVMKTAECPRVQQRCTVHFAASWWAACSCHRKSVSHVLTVASLWAVALTKQRWGQQGWTY